MASLTSPPFTAKVKWPSGTSNPVITEQNRRYVVNVDSENGNMTVVDTTGGTKKEIFNSEFDGNKSFVTIPLQELKNYPESVQKSILEVVGEAAKAQRANLLKDVPGNTTAPLKYVPGLSNTETPNAQNNSTIPELVENQKAGIDSLSKSFENGGGFKNSENLYYPLNIKEGNNSNQDYIKFEVIEYKPRIFNTEGLQRLQRYKGVERKVWSTINLPIQGGIADNNFVNWGEEALDALNQAASFASMSLQQGEPPDAVVGEFIKLLGDKSISSSTQSFLQAQLAKMAISSNNNLFSRAFGAILNPNMELLFQSVQLRPFTFRFDLTPRSREEAIMVKKIIRVFKQSMAPRQGVADIFLKTPMVFDVKYINGKKNGDHRSLNKIKTCALKNLSVNYTPSNQYMTYNDEEATMTAYSLEMQFQELEPVYFDDYDHSDFGNNNVSIGY